MKIAEIIKQLIEVKGGFKVDKAGVATKFGLTVADLAAYRNDEVSEEDIRLLSKHEAYEIYEDMYFIRTGINHLPDTLQPVSLDMVLAMGIEEAIKLLQSVIHKMGSPIRIDGILGARTKQSAVIACNVYGIEVLRAVCLARKSYYRDIVDKDASKSVFLSEWINRANLFLYAPHRSVYEY